MNVAEWKRGGRRVKTLDGEVFLRVDGERRGPTPLVLLHGFPTSSHDFEAVVPRLARDRTVVSFDFLGFGSSDKPPAFSYALHDQADVAIAVVREVGASRVHVVAHDMGTSVLTELLARRERSLLPFEIASVTFSNGSVHTEMAHLTPGQKILRTRLGPLFARLGTKRTFLLQLRRVFAVPPSDATLDAMYELVAESDGPSNFPAIIRYVDDRRRFAARWIGALERLDLPALVAWGELNPVAVLAIGERLAREIPNARFERFPTLGHYPQVEGPELFATALARFLDEIEPSRA